MSVIQHSWKLVVATGVSGVLAFVGLTNAADDKPADKPAAKADDKAAEEKPADEKAAEEKEVDRYAVPEDADSEALLKFIDELQSFRAKTRDEFFAHREKAMPAVRKAAAKVMELEKDDKKSKNYQKAQLTSIAIRLGELQTGSAEDIKAIIKETADYLAAKDPKDLDQNDARLASTVAQQLEFTGKPDLAKEALQTFSDVLKKGAEANEQLKPIVEGMAGTLRRMDLIGNEIEIKGKTVDGKDFDWAAYSKGKVILVDFWATWCGPCIGEMPNVKKNYDKYHDKGFDIVGISLDTDRKKLEEFLEKEETKWTTLFEDGVGWKHPVATYYGIQGIPTVILVDQKGKVVSLNARGPELGKLLEKLLGPASDEKSSGTEE
jgi:thiol-disulfide isomerase/thioredoxin